MSRDAKNRVMWFELPSAQPDWTPALFTLNRPDVLPVDDLGLREGVRLFGAMDVPEP